MHICGLQGKETMKSKKEKNKMNCPSEKKDSLQSMKEIRLMLKK